MLEKDTVMCSRCEGQILGGDCYSPGHISSQYSGQKYLSYPHCGKSGLAALVHPDMQVCKG
ncbi:hypothetical protein DPMN_061241 [Dreissena polymorpha]|uniref:Uncharacterized protein n=1 Tax=Dreissena polymorpha TaxID=45954 RepID=A0A9D4C6M7_DREPO|nr:hypothetical protein DPMN_061241 [Dreissena polymorpha]